MSDRPTPIVKELTADMLDHAIDPAEHGCHTLREFLIKKEAVHKPGQSVSREAKEDLTNRLAPDASRLGTMKRRAYGLFTPGDETPRFVVYVSFDSPSVTDDGVVAPKNYPSNMRNILEAENKHVDDPTVAVCYSISNRFFPDPDPNGFKAADLLSRVYREQLKVGQTSVKTMATLSPLANFDDWLDEKVATNHSDIMDGQTKAVLKRIQPELDMSPVEKFRHLYQDDQYQALTGNDLQAFNYVLENVGRYYLMEATKIRNGKDVAYDGVQWVHQGNGAELAKITPQRQHDDDNIIVTHPGGKSQNKLNISYHYVPEKERSANKSDFKDRRRRPADAKVDASHAKYMDRVTHELARGQDQSESTAVGL